MNIEDYNTTLDDADFNQKEASFKEAFSWWEKKRLLYNFILGGLGVFIMLTNIRMVDMMGIILTLIFAVIANIFYSLGFLLEAADIHYFSGRLKAKEGRWYLFILGTILGCLVILFFGFLIFI